MIRTDSSQFVGLRILADFSECPVVDSPLYRHLIRNPAHDFYAVMPENFSLMRRFGKFVRQVLAGKMQQFVQSAPPFGTIGHIVDDAVAGDPDRRAAFTGITVQFELCDDGERDLHRDWIIQRRLIMAAPRRAAALAVFLRDLSDRRNISHCGAHAQRLFQEVRGQDRFAAVPVAQAIDFPALDGELVHSARQLH